MQHSAPGRGLRRGARRRCGRHPPEVPSAASGPAARSQPPLAELRMNRKQTTIAIVVLLAAAAGAVGGYLYRRHTNPTFEERVKDAEGDLKGAFEKMTR